MMYNSRKFCDSHVKLDFNNVLIVPKPSKIQSRSLVKLEKTFRFNKKTDYTLPTKWSGVPIISSNMDTVTGLDTFNVLRQHNYISCFPKHLNKEWIVKSVLPEELAYIDNYMLCCGINKYDTGILVSLIDRLQKEGISIKFICIDIANGYLNKLLDVCSMFRERYPHLIIAAGNVVTPEGVQSIIKSGANLVKVGIGSGSCCTTRLKAGVGYPQLSAVLECSEAARSVGGLIISDGGIVHPADIVKAFAGGAGFVMLGSMLAGHTESPGELQLNSKDNMWYKTFYGMASSDAVSKYNAGMKNYRTAEGKTVQMRYKGDLIHTINDINGSLRSACTYVNATDLKELYVNSQFVLVNNTHNTSL